MALRQGELLVEEQRQRLASLPEFEPHAAFQRLDRDRNSFITSVDILQFLRSNGVEEASESDCLLIVKYFNGSRTDLPRQERACNVPPVLRFNDFLQVVMPCDKSHLRAEVA